MPQGCCLHHSYVKKERPTFGKPMGKQLFHGKTIVLTKESPWDRESGELKPIRGTRRTFKKSHIGTNGGFVASITYSFAGRGDQQKNTNVYTQCIHTIVLKSNMVCCTDNSVQHPEAAQNQDNSVHTPNAQSRSTTIAQVQALPPFHFPHPVRAAAAMEKTGVTRPNTIRGLDLAHSNQPSELKAVGRGCRGKDPSRNSRK